MHRHMHVVVNVLDLRHLHCLLANPHHGHLHLLVHWHINNGDHWSVDLHLHWDTYNLFVDLYLRPFDHFLDDCDHGQVTLLVHRNLYPVVHILELRHLSGLLDHSHPWHMDLHLTWHFNN